jgi:hypothetical protein
MSGPILAADSGVFSEESPRADGGIHVHGHWAIDVRNSDGTLAEHRDFENSYTGTALPALLGGTNSPADVAIVFTAQSNFQGGCTVVPPGPAGEPNFCVIGVNTNVGTSLTEGCPYVGCFSGATNSLVSVAGGYSALVVTGTIVASQNGAIGTVGTAVGTCYAGNASGLSPVSPQTCTESANGQQRLTQTSIPILNVTSGQILTLKVTITFS